MTRLLLAALAFLVLSLPAAASTVEQRSPFRQGHWWDPTRSGHGFEILNTDDQVMVVWYTYDANGVPTWYTAQGPRSSLGGVWNLQKHEWGGQRIARSTNVGTLRLTVDHFEQMRASWVLGGIQGTWTIKPFVESGTINEVDLTGHWYDPSNSGWGMTLLDQGDVFGAVVYAYDPAGQPTWLASFERGKGTRVDLRWTRGSCPSCPYRAIASEPAGTINIDYRGDTEATVRGTINVALAPGLRIDGARIAQLGRPASMRRIDFQLAPFAQKSTLKDFLVAGMEHRRFGSSGSDFSAAPPTSASSFSATNTQEAGVDEADVMKTDGQFVYSLVSASTTGLKSTVRVARVDGGSRLEPVGQFDIAHASSFYGTQASLYLHGGNLVALASTSYYGGWYYSPPGSAETTIEVLSVASPAAPTRRWHAKISGTIVSSRRIGDRLYVVSRFTPSIPGYISYAWTAEQRAANAALLAAAPVEAFVPSISIDGGPPTQLVATQSIYAPQLGATVPVADLVVVTAIDLAALRVVDTLAIAGRMDTLYVSTSNIYLSSSRYNFDPLRPAAATTSIYNTDVHQVAMDGDRLRYVGTGSVEGLTGWGEKASFRFGEHNGSLGVVTSLTNGWWSSNSNRVTILEPSTVAPGMLKTVSFLPNAARPQPLGKPNEQVYGTRFVGDKLYAVTFRQVDPLYIVDLANKADPRITGELELPGFSDYLHPLPGGMLLGFGRDATTNGLMQGLQLTLFDVSGAAPRILDQAGIGKRGSDSSLFRSHHAFSALARPDGSTIVAFPAAIHDGPTPAESWMSVPWSYSGLMRFEVRRTAANEARLIGMPMLVTAVTSGTQYTYGPVDERYGNGRSVLFQDACVFVGNGKFWRMDSAGQASGPY